MQGADLIGTVAVLIFAALVVTAYVIASVKTKNKSGEWTKFADAADDGESEEIPTVTEAMADKTAREPDAFAENLPTVSMITSGFGEAVGESGEDEELDEWEEAESDREEDTVIVNPDTGESVAYGKSFTAKIVQSDARLKQWYSDIKNILLSFEGVNSELSWDSENFSVNRKRVANLVIRGKTLCLNLAVTLNDTGDDVFDVPCVYRINCVGSAKRVGRIVRETLGVLSRPAVEVKPQDFRPDFKSTEQLIEEGHIRPLNCL